MCVPTLPKIFRPVTASAKCTYIILFKIMLKINWLSKQENVTLLFANNQGANQPAHCEKIWLSCMGTTKMQTIQRICAVWSATLLFAI